ncbi:MAG: protein jag [Hyphomicrobiales bacterium]
MNDKPGILVDGETFDEAVLNASVQLGVKPTELGLEVLDPGASPDSSTGFRPVKIRAWRREQDVSADGLRRNGGGRRGPAPGRDRHDRGDRGDRGGRRERRAPVSYGPPPPPMDPEKITPELVADVRGIAEGIVGHMEFPATVVAEKTKHGIRVAIDAGENDQYLIGPDGETLSALQHLLGRILRARAPDEAPPRLEVDVAGFRDRQIERLREMARELMEEARASGDEVTTEPLPASERRIVHLEVAEVPGMETVTVGDGFYKRVVIRRAAGDAAPKER